MGVTTIRNKPVGRFRKKTQAHNQALVDKKVAEIDQAIHGLESYFERVIPKNLLDYDKKRKKIDALLAQLQRASLTAEEYGDSIEGKHQKVAAEIEQLTKALQQEVDNLSLGSNDLKSDATKHESTVLEAKQKLVAVREALDRDFYKASEQENFTRQRAVYRTPDYVARTQRSENNERLLDNERPKLHGILSELDKNLIAVERDIHRLDLTDPDGVAAAEKKRQTAREDFFLWQEHYLAELKKLALHNIEKHGVTEKIHALQREHAKRANEFTAAMAGAANAGKAKELADGAIKHFNSACQQINTVRHELHRQFDTPLPFYDYEKRIHLKGKLVDYGKAHQQYVHKFNDLVEQHFSDNFPIPAFSNPNKIAFPDAKSFFQKEPLQPPGHPHRTAEEQKPKKPAGWLDDVPSSRDMLLAAEKLHQQVERIHSEGVPSENKKTKIFDAVKEAEKAIKKYETNIAQNQAVIDGMQPPIPPELKEYQKKQSDLHRELVEYVADFKKKSETYLGAANATPGTSIPLYEIQTESDKHRKTLKEITTKFDESYHELLQRVSDHPVAAKEFQRRANGLLNHYQREVKDQLSAYKADIEKTLAEGDFKTQRLEDFAGAEKAILDSINERQENVKKANKELQTEFAKWQAQLDWFILTNRERFSGDRQIFDLSNEERDKIKKIDLKKETDGHFKLKLGDGVELVRGERRGETDVFNLKLSNKDPLSTRSMDDLERAIRLIAARKGKNEIEITEFKNAKELARIMLACKRNGLECKVSDVALNLRDSDKAFHRKKTSEVKEAEKLAEKWFQDLEAKEDKRAVHNAVAQVVHGEAEFNTNAQGNTIIRDRTGKEICSAEEYAKHGTGFAAGAKAVYEFNHDETSAFNQNYNAVLQAKWAEPQCASNGVHQLLHDNPAYQTRCDQQKNALKASLDSTITTLANHHLIPPAVAEKTRVSKAVTGAEGAVSSAAGLMRKTEALAGELVANRSPATTEIFEPNAQPDFDHKNIDDYAAMLREKMTAVMRVINALDLVDEPKHSPRRQRAAALHAQVLAEGEHYFRLAQEAGIQNPEGYLFAEGDDTAASRNWTAFKHWGAIALGGVAITGAAAATAAGMIFAPGATLATLGAGARSGFKGLRNLGELIADLSEAREHHRRGIEDDQMQSQYDTMASLVMQDEVVSICKQMLDLTNQNFSAFITSTNQEDNENRLWLTLKGLQGLQVCQPSLIEQKIRDKELPVWVALVLQASASDNEYQPLDEAQLLARLVDFKKTSYSTEIAGRVSTTKANVDTAQLAYDAAYAAATLLKDTARQAAHSLTDAKAHLAVAENTLLQMQANAKANPAALDQAKVEVNKARKDVNDANTAFSDAEKEVEAAQAEVDEKARALRIAQAAHHAADVAKQHADSVGALPGDDKARFDKLVTVAAIKYTELSADGRLKDITGAVNNDVDKPHSQEQYFRAMDSATLFAAYEALLSRANPGDSKVSKDLKKVLDDYCRNDPKNRFPFPPSLVQKLVDPENQAQNDARHEMLATLLHLGIKRELTEAYQIKDIKVNGEAFDITNPDLSPLQIAQGLEAYDNWLKSYAGQLKDKYIVAPDGTVLLDSRISNENLVDAFIKKHLREQLKNLKNNYKDPRSQEIIRQLKEKLTDVANNDPIVQLDDAIVKLKQHQIRLDLNANHALGNARGSGRYWLSQAKDADVSPVALSSILKNYLDKLAAKHSESVSMGLNKDQVNEVFHRFLLDQVQSWLTNRVTSFHDARVERLIATIISNHPGATYDDLFVQLRVLESFSHHLSAQPAVDLHQSVTAITGAAELADALVKYKTILGNQLTLLHDKHSVDYMQHVNRVFDQYIKAQINDIPGCNDDIGAVITKLKTDANALGAGDFFDPNSLFNQQYQAAVRELRALAVKHYLQTEIRTANANISADAEPLDLDRALSSLIRIMDTAPRNFPGLSPDQVYQAIFEQVANEMIAKITGPFAAGSIVGVLKDNVKKLTDDINRSIAGNASDPLVVVPPYQETCQDLRGLLIEARNAALESRVQAEIRKLDQDIVLVNSDNRKTQVEAIVDYINALKTERSRLLAQYPQDVKLHSFINNAVLAKLGQIPIAADVRSERVASLGGRSISETVTRDVKQAIKSYEELTRNPGTEAIGERQQKLKEIDDSINSLAENYRLLVKELVEEEWTPVLPEATVSLTQEGRELIAAEQAAAALAAAEQVAAEQAAAAAALAAAEQAAKVRRNDAVMSDITRQIQKIKIGAFAFNDVDAFGKALAKYDQMLQSKLAALLSEYPERAVDIASIAINHHANQMNLLTRLLPAEQELGVMIDNYSEETQPFLAEERAARVAGSDPVHAAIYRLQHDAMSLRASVASNTIEPVQAIIRKLNESLMTNQRLAETVGRQAGERSRQAGEINIARSSISKIETELTQNFKIQSEYTSDKAPQSRVVANAGASSSSKIQLKNPDVIQRVLHAYLSKFEEFYKTVPHINNQVPAEIQQVFMAHFKQQMDTLYKDMTTEAREHADRAGFKCYDNIRDGDFSQVMHEMEKFADEFPPRWEEQHRVGLGL